MDSEEERRPQRIALEPPEMKQLIKTSALSPSRKFAIISRHIWNPTQSPQQIVVQPTSVHSRPIIDMLGNPPEKLAPPGTCETRTSDAGLHTTKRQEKPRLSELIIGEKQAERIQASEFSPSSPKKRAATPEIEDRLPLLPEFHEFIAILPDSFADMPGSDPFAEEQRSAVLSTVCNCRFADEFPAATTLATSTCMQSTLDVRSVGYFEQTDKCAKLNLAGSIENCRDLAVKAKAEAIRLYGLVANEETPSSDLCNVARLFLAALKEDSTVTKFFQKQRKTSGVFFNSSVKDFNLRVASKLLRSGFLDMLEREICACHMGVESARYDYYVLIFALCNIVTPVIRDSSHEFVGNELVLKVKESMDAQHAISMQCLMGIALLCRCNYNFAYQIMFPVLERAEAQFDKVREVIDRTEVQRVRETYDELEMSDYSDEVYEEPETRGYLLNAIRRSEAANGTIGIRSSARIEKHLLKKKQLEHKRDSAVEELRKILYLANIIVACLCEFASSEIWRETAEELALILRNTATSGIYFSEAKLRPWEEEIFEIIERVQKWRFQYIISGSIMSNQAADLVPSYQRLLREE